jgi:hypothetical protein
MANKKLLLGMLAIALAFGMTAVGCDDDPANEENYLGEWTGTFTKDGNSVTATMTLNDTVWALASGDTNLNGVYTVGTGADFYMTVRVGNDEATTTTENIRVAGGIVLGNTLTVTFTTMASLGSVSGIAVIFTRVRETPPDPPVTDAFIGTTWTGTVTSSTGTWSGTLTFTETNWTLTVPNGPSSPTGTYTQTIKGITATLKISGDITYATCLVKGETLSVTFINGSYAAARAVSFEKSATP